MNTARSLLPASGSRLAQSSPASVGAFSVVVSGKQVSARAVAAFPAARPRRCSQHLAENIRQSLKALCAFRQVVARGRVSRVSPFVFAAPIHALKPKAWSTHGRGQITHALGNFTHD